MSAKQVALDDMRKCGLDVSFFLYDIWFGDGRKFNGGYHPKRTVNYCPLTGNVPIQIGSDVK